MIRSVTVENFKRFRTHTFELKEAVVLAGPNNSGKSTLLQALSTWALARDRWNLKKADSDAKARTATPLTRKDFTSLPLRDFDLLWRNRSTALSKDELGPTQKLGAPRLILIRVDGDKNGEGGDPWHLTMELRHQGPEQIYVKPVVDSTEAAVPKQALDLAVVHCPPFSGIGAEERRLDRGAQNHELGRGKPGEILRNLLLEVSQANTHWDSLVNDIEELFRFRLLRPEYEDAMTPFILCEYLAGIPAGKGKNGLPRYDVASGGSGFHQVLLLLAFFYARPASVILVDEPDAHLHVILQRQIYDRLRSVAADRASQLIVATHSEVVLEGTSPSRVISFLGEPHCLVRADQRDQVREAMKELTTLDLLLAEQGRSVLYCEGDSDFKILSAFAEKLKHPASGFFRRPFFHSNTGRNPRDARRHLFALRAIHPEIQGLLLLDGDNRGLPDHEIAADGLVIRRWKRYEIENYLVVPAALTRFLSPPGEEDLFTSNAAERALEYLRAQLPPGTFESPLEDNATVTAVRASKDLLPQMFSAAGHPMEKEDLFLIVEKMLPAEIHPDVISILDQVAAMIPPSDSEAE